MRYEISDIRCGIPSGDDLKFWLPGFPQLPDKLEFGGMLSKTFPRGGRCPSAHTGADEGLTHRNSPPCRIKGTISKNLLFLVSAEEISTFPLIRHGFAVPPSPEGEGLAQHLCKHLFIGQLSKTDMHIVKNRNWPFTNRRISVIIHSAIRPGGAVG